MTDVFRALGPIDLRNVRRDELLAWVMFLPILLALIMRLLVPWLSGALWNRFGFDLGPYYPLLLSYFIITMFPATFGTVIGFLLLDERDEGTLTALRVTPLSMTNYLLYRVSLPMALTFIVIFLAFPIANLGRLDLPAILVAALAAMPLAPLFALLLAGFAANKVQGFAVIKAVGGILLVVPLFGFFVQSPLQWAFGLLPTFLPMKVYWVLEAGAAFPWVQLLLALAYQALLLGLLLRRFNSVLRQ
jgi:fluoroquinolone transport system permease protein